MNDALLREIAQSIQTPPFVGALVGQSMSIFPHPPAELNQVLEAEQRIGLRLPDFLRLLYLDVGNGGFDPAYGLLGVDHGATDDLNQNAVDLWSVAHRELPKHLSEQSPSPHPYLFPCIYCGCTSYLCVDCRAPDSQLWEFDPGAGDHWEHVFCGLQLTLEELMRDWLISRDEDCRRTP